MRFHYGGEFLTVGGHLQYFGGGTGMSVIDVDKLSLPEIEGHLADHMPMYGGVQLHWLYPGMGLDEGLRMLYDDYACADIPKHIPHGELADIYVEVIVNQDAKDMVVDQAVKYREDSDWELEISEADGEQEEMYFDIPSSMPSNVVTTPEKVKDNDFFSFRQFYQSPPKYPPCKSPTEKGLPCCHAISAIYKSSKKLDDFIDPCYSITEYIKTYQFCLQPVEGQESWPISDMPRPHPPAYVKMPGRKKTKRTREVGEKPTGTKITKVGVKMACSLCKKTTHNIRRCPYNRQVGQKKNAHIKRDAKRQRKQASEASTSTAGPIVSQFLCTYTSGLLFCL